MRPITFVVALLTAAPVCAQARLYTNADLSPHPVTTWTRTVTPAELDALRQYQHVTPWDLPDGPTAFVLASGSSEFRVTTDELINRPAGYTQDLLIFNEASRRLAWLGSGGYGYRHVPLATPRPTRPARPSRRDLISTTP